MSTQTQDEGSLKGLGAEILLPARGNPFQKTEEPTEVGVLAAGAERMAPEAAQPPEGANPPKAAESPAQFSVEVTPAPTPAQTPSEVTMAEPHDLSPEDVMALFPSSHAERENPEGTASGSLPAALAALPAEPVVDLPVQTATATESVAVPPAAPETMFAEPAATLPTPPLETVVTDAPTAEPMPAAPAPVATVEPPAPAPTIELMPAAPAMPAPLAEAAPLPALVEAPSDTAEKPEDMPATPAPLAPTAVVVGAGQPPRGMRAVGGGSEQLALSIGEVGPAPEAYKADESLKANAELANMFVPNGKLMTLWLEIETIEAQIAAANNMSLKLARELLDRLVTARNHLMNDRTHYEDAARQVSEVKYRLARFKNSNAVQFPTFIFAYLLIFLALILLGFVEGGAVANLINQAAGAKFDLLIWYAILWGGIGGITGGLYGLWGHVARDQDYDPQFCLWYYTNPLMGLILGAFIYLVVRVGVLSVGGQVSDVGQAAGTNPISSSIMYFIAWAVGFQQNLAFSLANTLLKKLIPAEEKGSAPTPAPASAPAPGDKPAAKK